MKCDNKFSLMQEQQFQKGLIHFLITALRNSNTRKSVFLQSGNLNFITKFNSIKDVIYIFCVRV